MKKELPEAATADSTPEPLPEVHGTSGNPTQAEPSPLGSRLSEKAQALKMYGGAGATEQAVSAGLMWLALHRDGDGSWDPGSFDERCPSGDACRDHGFPEYRVGVTALALLAFLGAGIDGERSSEFRQVVRDGLVYLLAEQDATGCIGPREGQYMYNHAIASFCLAEAAVLTRQPRYREAAGRALHFSSRAQQPGGGWDYTAARTLRNDLSITGWQVMAIYAAQEAGIPIPQEMLERLDKHIRRAVHSSGWSTYADRGVGKFRGGVSIAAVGMLCKLYLGWPLNSLENSADILIWRKPDPEARLDWDHTFQSCYYWYYATLALFHLGGDRWEAWNIFLKRIILPLQRQDGHANGSWDPDPNWIGHAGGRITSTALHVLIFEVYYRYTPLHKKIKPPASEAGKERR
ncbi:MAG: hypothetical protein V3T77_00700 [Planctomycetota bacterium]